MGYIPSASAPFKSTDYTDYFDYFASSWSEKWQRFLKRGRGEASISVICVIRGQNKGGRLG